MKACGNIQVQSLICHHPKRKIQQVPKSLIFYPDLKITKSIISYNINVLCKASRGKSPKMNVIVGKVRDHLEDIRTKNTRSKSSILSELDSTLCHSLPTNDAVDLIARIASLLPDLRQDATKLTELAERIAENAPITFEDILTVVPSDAIQAGLGIEQPTSINHVSLALLRATKSEAEISIVASKEKLVMSLVNLWLRTEDIGVGLKAWRVLAHLLGVDIDKPEKDQVTVLRTIDTNTHLMWRRLVTDQNTYDLLFSLTCLSTLGQSGQLSRRAKGVSQFRLMELIITFWPVKSLWTSSLPEINKLYGIKAGEGLVHYCLLHMVDAKDDILEQIQLVESYSKFLRSSSWGDDPLTGSRPNLEFLIQHGVHADILSQFAYPDQDDPLQGLIQSSIIEYVRTYVSCFPRHFLRDTTGNKDRILEHIWKVLGSTSQNKWARNDDPTGLLGLFSSLPREIIFSTTSNTNPILSLPLRPFNTKIISSLAIIFNGPQTRQDTESSTIQVEAVSAAAARCLFLIYLGANPTFFEDIIAKASSVAVPEVASTAMDMLLSLATASWNRKELLAANESSAIPGEESLRAQCSFYGHYTLPGDGVSALLLPPAVIQILPFLLSSSRHLTGDAYSVAQKKFDVAAAMLRKVELFLARGVVDENGLGMVAQTLRVRLQKGILGEGVGVAIEGGEDVTHSVATMSR